MESASFTATDLYKSLSLRWAFFSMSKFSLSNKDSYFPENTF